MMFTTLTALNAIHPSVNSFMNYQPCILPVPSTLSVDCMLPFIRPHSSRTSFVSQRHICHCQQFHELLAILLPVCCLTLGLYLSASAIFSPINSFMNYWPCTVYPPHSVACLLPAIRPHSSNCLFCMHTQVLYPLSGMGGGGGGW